MNTILMVIDKSFNAFQLSILDTLNSPFRENRAVVDMYTFQSQLRHK